MNIHDKVYNYPTKHKEGFVQSEVYAILKDYRDVDMEKFNSALMGNTCMVKEARYRDWETDRKSTRLNSSHRSLSRMPSSA